MTINLSDQLLGEAIEALPTGLALFDATERLVIANSAFRKMLPSGAALLDEGATFAEMARHNALTYFGVTEDQIENWMEARLKYRDQTSGVFDQKLTSGHHYRIQESNTAEGGKITFWTDITDLKKLENQSLLFTEQLQEKNKELSEFAYIASHDLQEPLRKIETFAERLESRAGDALDERSGMYLEKMVDAAHRMRNLINGLLEYSRADQGDKAHEQVDLEQVLNEVEANLEVTLENSQGVMTVADMPKVLGNQTQITRLILNLMTNALKYTAPDRSPVIEVTSSVVIDGEVQINISDNGIGFKQEDADSIFKIFHRLHGRSEYQGTGIGLASCRKIVEAHGGKIWATGTPGSGAVFSLTLPSA